MKTVVKTSTINPKAMSKSQLLGHINVDTRQWSDGVITLKAQEVYNDTEGNTTVYIFNVSLQNLTPFFLQMFDPG